MAICPMCIPWTSASLLILLLCGRRPGYAPGASVEEDQVMLLEKEAMWKHH